MTELGGGNSGVIFVFVFVFCVLILLKPLKDRLKPAFRVE
jgi:hypothetical protein